jgi:hypothetical protein
MLCECQHKHVSSYAKLASTVQQYSLVMIEGCETCLLCEDMMIVACSGFCCIAVEISL